MNIYQNYINGKFCDNGVFAEVINPANGQVFAKAAVASAADLEQALSCARLAFDQGQWPKFSLEQRKQCLLNISQKISECAQELINLETLNNGKPVKESTFMDVPAAGQVFEHFAENLEQYLAQETIEINSPIAKVSSNLIRQPRGVSVLIVPFNYPLLIACWKLAASLAAGNTVILKPSSLTPLSVMELAKLIDRCGLPVGVVNILNVPGEQAGKILCSDKRVDMISFTGSNSAGKKIIEYSSSNIKKLTMELGGKSASLIFADADYQAAINAGLCSIFLNQGQMCTAMSRILIEDKIYNQFKNEFVEKAAKIKLGDGREFETQMGPLISRSQQENCVRFITAARTAGAKILTGGKIPSGEQFTEGFFFEPTVLEEVTAQMDIFQQEVFGPIVCLVKFSTVEQAINLANDSSFALAACVWSKDLEKAKAIAEKINAGTIWINTYGMFFPQLPYGGFKQSGFGKELGKEGLGEYTCLKNIITDLAEKPMTAYWYGF